MVINRDHLLQAKPFDAMFAEKQTGELVSHGMSEAGYDIRIKQGMTLHPLKRFAIASSVERFEMPINIMAIVHDKSSWARRGLSVFNTVIEPGWCGWLTIEMVYHGWKPLHIPAGSGIAQVIFHELSVPVAYSGRYQDQPDRPVEAINVSDKKETTR
jgi:dCTP deaminase